MAEVFAGGLKVLEEFKGRVVFLQSGEVTKGSEVQCPIGGIEGSEQALRGHG